MASNVATPDKGQPLDLDSLPATINYAGGFVSTIVIENYNGYDYTQTFTNDGTNITGYSRWVRTPSTP